MMKSWFLRGLSVGLVGCFANTTVIADSVSPRPAWTTSRIQGMPEPPPPFRVTAAFPNLQFELPTSITEIPGQQRLLVTEMGGKIFSFLKNGDVAEPTLMVNLNDLLPADVGDEGVSLLHAAFHPRFTENRYLFLCYANPIGGSHHRVSRFTLTGDAPPKLVSDSERVLIRWPVGGHSGGCLQFGRDGYLYISTGDGSGPNPPDGLTTGQDVSDLLGAILRIDVDQITESQAYVVPPDNPFVGRDGVRPEVWAYGLRNPWKFGADTKTDAVFAADNGWETWEMVHRIERGGNCGWPIMEGRASLRTEVTRGPTPIIPPAKDHLHTEANSVIGGPIYRGTALPELDGWFVYGDYITGTIWALQADAQDEYRHKTLVDTDQRIVAFCQGSRGEIYVLDYDFTGQVYQLLPSGLEDISADFPRRLSETGLFSSLKDLTPAPGVVSYSVAAKPWNDGAESQRWVAIPGSGKIRLGSSVGEPGHYPEGTVLVKHLSLPAANAQTTPIETQILHFENGQWRPYSYLWDETGIDAHLVSSIGENRSLRAKGDVEGETERSWHVGARTECRLCHNAGSKSILGFTSHQLNRVRDGGSQITSLAALGVLAEAPTIREDDPSRLIDPHDVSKSLDDRARSYLHANCSSCHHPGGSAIVSFYLRRDLPFDQLNTNKGTGIGTFGMHNAKIIVAGDPYRSVLLYRMSKLGYGRMPYIGSRVVDGFGVTLVEEWIRSLAKRAFHASAPTLPESADFLALNSLSNSAGDRDRRDTAIQQLTETTEGTLALVAQMHRGALDEVDHQSAVAQGSKSARSDIRGLFEHFVPESERRATLGPNIRPETILGLDGDVARGKLIFYSDGARCQNCHDVSDQQKSVGPTLGEINKKYPRLVEMVTHIIDPSQKVDDQFATYLAVTSSGRLVTGLLLKDSDNEVVMKTAEKKIVRLQRDEIDELQRSTKSLMPDAVLSDLTAQEAADLLAFIRSFVDEGSSGQ